MGYVKFKDPQTGEMWRSDTDLHLIRESVSVGSPDVKTMELEIPGASGLLDCSEIFGKRLYDTRPVAIACGKAIADRYAQDSLVKNALHGKRLQIFLSEDLEHYYLGRVSVGEFAVSTGIGKVTISAPKCDPYKYRADVTRRSVTVPDSGTLEVVLQNEFMPVAPTVTATAAATIAFGVVTYSIEANKAYKNLDMELAPGSNLLRIYAAAGTSVVFEYQEGSL